MNINEDKVKRELERSRKALNLMFSGGLSRRSRKAKKQRKIAMGPMSKVSVDTSDREDSQTMLNLKDKIAETLLNSFNELLNEGGKSSPKRIANRRERQAVKKGMFNLGSAVSMATKDPRRNDARARRRSKAAAKAILQLNPGERARQDAEEVVRRTRS